MYTFNIIINRQTKMSELYHYITHNLITKDDLYLQLKTLLAPK